MQEASAPFFTGFTRLTLRPVANAIVFVVVSLGMWLGQACVASDQNTRIVCGACEELNRFVRLQTGKAATRPGKENGFSHPFHLSSQDWKLLLTSVQVRNLPTGYFGIGHKGSPTAAFTTDEVEYLSGTLKKAFDQARSDELVVFGLSKQSSSEIWEVTTGAWFVADSNLHLVLANYRSAVTMANIRELLRDEPLRSIAGPFYELVSGDYQTLVQDEDSLSQVLWSAKEELSIAYQPFLLAELTPHSDALDHASDKTTLPSKAPSFSPPTLEERLRILKRWKDRGLITEEDYRLKKKELLEQF